ncbi:MAG: 7-cyano-7-deazaguanine synthase [Bradyrhizobium sp.]|uniref:7-cyano-7-deazaguanine synthase n=1 Tax=Bradyrhizobium sp. TaxID=376 RepID=UPI001C286DD7|nr:7-cyano-7-deazaguanine synthase [Bradyrhizobium sp.]MBU6464009.1 7-cyano-7-deazaguanine synthase [Pseudomonadota bacterium]MDE2069028.1 7-cyano-7-deazaguanine synthase [Bradyrhizobium sp.]MDE2469348.1 7-cyano-7-deazaguanine synthase [Bradyrhizobium sp.]
MTTALLLSGGMDSTCIAYWKRPSLAITINYGQKAAAGEMRASTAICEALDIQHVVVEANISALGSGDMVGRAPSVSAPATEWWPYRNQFLITTAAMKCHAAGVSELMFGSLKSDGFHADGAPPFFMAINHLLELQEGTVAVTTPAIHLDAHELVQVSRTPIEILAWSHSCHVDDIACGFCRGCRKHFETMSIAFGHSY